MFVLHDSGHVSLHCGSLGIEQSGKNRLAGWMVEPGLKGHGKQGVFFLKHRDDINTWLIT